MQPFARIPELAEPYLVHHLSYREAANIICEVSFIALFENVLSVLPLFCDSHSELPPDASAADIKNTTRCSLSR
jgi:hypothetical protein